ncbi:MAG: KH domain-containing protein [Candidatus Saccharimonadales bacterium]
MSSIDQQFIEYIVKSLVEKPDAVSIERTIDEKGVLLELTVDPEDLGRVIGKRGSTAQSLRSLLRALGTKNDARYNLKIVDVDRPEGERDTPRQSAPVKDTSPSDDVDDQPVDKSATETVDNDSDRMKNTRKELAELDDLDI